MQQRIITLSREWASGGHTIAQLAAEKLGIPCYDSQIIKEVARKTGFSEELIHDAEQRMKSSYLYNMISGVNSERNYIEQIYRSEREIILEKAAEGSCIIVGRGADYVVWEKLPTLRVFIYSNLKRRIRRAVENYGVDEQHAKKEIQRMDKERSLHMKTFTGLTWGDRINYDLMLNAGFLGEEECSNLIIKAYQDMMDWD